MALLPQRRLARHVLAVEQVQHRESGVGGLVDLERRGEEARVHVAALERLKMPVQCLLECRKARHCNTSAESGHDTMLKRIAPITPDQNPPTSKPSSQVPTIQKSRPLSTKMKRPSVSTVTGSVSSTSTGRTTALTRPSTNAATSAAPKLETLIDGIR